MRLYQGMHGLGDNIYQRCFIKALPGPIYLETPWPELYQDLKHVKPCKKPTKLRTQAKNVARQNHWNLPPRGLLPARVRYRDKGIFLGMRDTFRVKPCNMDLPDFPSPVEGDYVVVRPVTVREEWRAESRNPLPEYVYECAEEMRRRGYKVVSVADLEPSKEWLVGEAPPADIQYHRGELDVKRLMGLIRGAKATIGGIGWILPASMAYDVPAWLIAGGNGGYNHPDLITPPGDHSATFALPDNFCRCKEKVHNCDKRITNHLDKFKEWADGLCL